jgi:hypothetical protein
MPSFMGLNRVLKFDCFDIDIINHPTLCNKFMRHVTSSDFGFTSKLYSPVTSSDFGI